MTTKRPKVVIPLESTDKFIELLSLILILLMWTHTIVQYPDLPETIASHFNANGQADAFSHKSFLWFLPIIASVTYLGLFFLNKFPHLHNYMVNITEKNARQQYKFSTRILRIVNFLCALMFGYINYQIIVGAIHGKSELGVGFLISVIAVSVLLPVFILIYQKRLNSN
jgi:uncharacterized membrane protein